jgi:lysophospholipase-2
VKFILPTAKMQKVTMNMGMAMPAWYDIIGLDKRSNEICPGIDESQQRILDILKSEHDAGIPYNRMVLAGFSQGAALSLYTGMQLPDASGPLAGIVMMSGYLPHASGFDIAPGSEDTPIFHGHGAVDPLVQITAAKESQSHVTEKGATNYQLKIYEGLAHSANPKEIGDVIDFLDKILPPCNECYIKLKDPSEMSVKELKAAVLKAGIGSRAVGFSEKSEFVDLLRNHRAGKL